MAGSVAASVAPTRSATENGSEKTGMATSATTTAVIRMPGRTSIPRPTAVREMTRNEIPTPPWKRISETPRVNTSWAPSPSTGFSTRSSTDGPTRTPGHEQHDHQRQAEQDRDRDRHDPGEQDQADVAKDVLCVHARRLRPTAADQT